MKHLFVCFSLLCMVLLAACGGGDSAPSAQPQPSQSVEAAGESGADPLTDPVPDRGEPPAPEGQAPSQSGEVSPSAIPETTPVATPAASAQPTPTPAAEPTAAPDADSAQESAPPETSYTAAELREYFMLTSSSSDTPTASFTDMSGYLENFYNLSADDLDDFVLYMPDMSTALQEFFLAKAKPGRLEAVEAACQSRLAGLKEDAAFYAGTARFVDVAQVETVGDWVVLAVCPEAGRMAKILEDFVK